MGIKKSIRPEILDQVNKFTDVDSLHTENARVDGLWNQVIAAYFAVIKCRGGGGRLKLQ